MFSPKPHFTDVDHFLFTNVLPLLYCLFIQNHYKMKDNNQHTGIIRWAARILSIAFALFLSIFAMDVFSEGYGFWQTILALLMHLVPTFLILLILLISWKREWIGAGFYTILGILYIVLEWGKFDWAAYALIAGPLFVLGILFFIGWNQERHKHT